MIRLRRGAEVLEKLHRVALALAPLQGLCLTAVAVLGAIVALSIFEISVFAGDVYLIPSFVGFLWLLALYSFIVCFRSLPPRKGPGAGWSMRLRLLLARGAYWLIAVLLLCVSVSLVLVSVRFLRIWNA